MPLPRDLDIFRPWSSRTRPWMNTVWKGGLAGLLAAGEDHPGHPEEDDVIAGDQHVGGVEIVQVLGSSPASPGWRRATGRRRTRCPARRGPGGCGLQCSHSHTVGSVRLTVMWPQSSQYHTGIWWPHHSWREMHQSWTFLHPVGVGLGEALGDKLGLPVVHHPQGLLGQGSIFTNHWAEMMGSTSLWQR